jgi:hypothetical protein
VISQTFSPFEVPVIAEHPRDQLVDAPTQYHRFSLDPADAAQVINAPRDVTLPVTRTCAPRTLTSGDRSDRP